MENFVLGFIIGATAAAAVIYWLLYSAFSHARKKLEQLIQEAEQTQAAVTARVEEHEGVFFLYDISDETFIAQGRTISELQQRIDSRYHAQTTVHLKSDSAEVLDRLKNSV